MKKRVISILLCLLMLTTSALSIVGCGKSTPKIFTKEKAKAMTITITTIYDDYDPNNAKQVEALKQVQDALNNITETKYNTHVVIQPMKSEDYMNQIISMTEKIDAELQAEADTLDEIKSKNNNKLENAQIIEQISKRKAAAKYQVIGDGYLTAANDDLVYKDEFGRYQTMYPSVDKEGNYVDTGIQLDIVLVNSAEMYNTMVDRGFLYLLSGDFLTQNSVSNQLIQKHVNQVALDYVDIDGTAESNELYAIPNNTVYGEYSYLLVNRELFDEYGYDINFDYNPVGDGKSNKVDDFSDLENFILELSNDAEKSEYRPVLNNPQLEFLSYFGEQSVMIADATSKYNTDVGAVPKCITNSVIFQSYFRTMYTLTKDVESRRPVTDKWLTAEDLLTTYKDEKFGVAFAKGSLAMIEQFAGTAEEPGDYYAVVTHTPYIDNNVYESMYGISSCIAADTFNSELRAMRCFQILELFSTNPDWVNILTYGVEGEQYEFSALEEGLVVNRSSDYTFDRKYAGNMFHQYLSEDMDPVLRAYAENNWDLAKRQNLNVSTSPYAGFTIMTEKSDAWGKDYIEVELGSITMQIPNGKEGQKVAVSGVLNSWKAADEKYFALLQNYDHYEAYVAENPGATFDDYYKMFTRLVQADEYYLFIASPNENSPQAQYNEFFMSKRDDAR
ncbi:MAG: hypothetical protein E7616_01900 [Ruminococcaceae bacterium]|nr:hypothetical protein [Oscillospiraceae bacterium]